MILILLMAGSLNLHLCTIIQQIDINDKENFRASSNYQQVAIDHGWWDPESGKEFIWQEVYAPVPRECATSRFWLFNALYNPHLPGLPDRWTTDSFKGDDQYTQFVEPLSLNCVPGYPTKQGGSITCMSITPTPALTCPSMPG